MIKQLRTRSGKVYEVTSRDQYAEIKEHETVFVVETRYGTKIRIFADAVESVEHREDQL
jgi:hypothetical protein